MANVDNPRGLTPIRHRNGAPYNGAGNPYFIPSTYATNVFIGDAVIKTGTSNTSEVKDRGGKYAAGTLPEVNRATVGDGNAITGIVVGFLTDPSNDENVYGAASTDRVAVVADDPDLVFVVQDDASATLAATSVGLNANLVDTHSGSTSSGRSGTELDATTPSADASNQLTIQRLYAVEDNELGNNARWEVKINNHTEAHGVIGI